MAELKLSVLHKPGGDNYKLLTSQNEAPQKTQRYQKGENVDFREKINWLTN